MCIIVIEPLTPLDRTSRMKLYKNNARSRLFCRIAERSIETLAKLSFTRALLFVISFSQNGGENCRGASKEGGGCGGYNPCPLW